MMHYVDRSAPPHYSAAAAKLHHLQSQNQMHRSGGMPVGLGLHGSSLVSSTGEQTPSMVRQYGGLTRKYASDGGDELAACLPPDLRHLLTATTAATPSSHHRQTTAQRLQQHGLMRNSAAAANSLSAANPRGLLNATRKPWASSSWSYYDEDIGYSSAADRRMAAATSGRQTPAFFGGLHDYRAGGRTTAATRSLTGVYDANSQLYRCSTSNVPDHLERRWYQNQQQRQPGGVGVNGGRLIRRLAGAKHLSDAYDDDDLLRMQQDDATATAMLLDDMNIGGGYGSRNSDFLPTRPRSRSYSGGEDPASSTSWRHWTGSGYLGGALRETAIGSSAAIFDHNGHRRGTAGTMNATTADHKRWDVRRQHRRQRRYSDGGESDSRRAYDYPQNLQMTSAAMDLSKYGTGGGGGRRSRSWDPSPSPTPIAYLSGGGGGGGDDGYGGYGGGYGGGDYADDYGGDYETLAALAAEEEHDEELQREEKKARIKAEIARRRRQIEDNVRLHEELLRLARIRENAEHEYSSSMLPSLSAAGR